MQPKKQAQEGSKFCNSALQSLPAAVECCAVRAHVLQTPVSWFWLTRRKVSGGQLGSEQLPRTAGREPVSVFPAGRSVALPSLALSGHTAGVERWRWGRLLCRQVKRQAGSRCTCGAGLVSE